MFHDKVQAKVDGGCTCWDCLRAVGLTPPFQLRHKYPRRYPHTVFNKLQLLEDGTSPFTGDTGGVPQAKVSRETKKSHQTAEEQAHLREAVRNREVI